MILESLITDGRAWTLDCHKATVRKGDIIEVPDQLYFHPEVQGGIKLGFVKVVGDAPAVSPPEVIKMEEETKVRMKSEAVGILAFDCIKASVVPNGTIMIPQSKMSDPEIRSAIDAGLLVDPDAPKVEALPKGTPVAIEEVDIVDQPRATAAPRKRRGRTAPQQDNQPQAIKAKRVASSGDDDVVEGSSDGLYQESRVIEPKNENALKPRQRRTMEPEQAPKQEEIVDDKFSFLDVFGT